MNEIKMIFHNTRTKSYMIKYAMNGRMNKCFCFCFEKLKQKKKTQDNKM